MAQDRIKSLDGLRAFAIIFVLLAHSLWQYSEPVTIYISRINFHNILYNGWFGVELFFVLSGFLIASQLLKKPITRNNLKKFWCKRFFRIAPAYYVMVFITLMFLHIKPWGNVVPISDLFAKWWFPFLSHLIFLNDYIGREPIINGIFWSIPIEMKFYMILPICIYLLTKLKENIHQIYFIIGIYSIYLMVKSASLYVNYGFSEVAYINYFLYIKTPFQFALDGLIIGVLCAFILKNERVNKIKSGAEIFSLMLAFGLSIIFLVAEQDYFAGSVSRFFDRTAITPLFSIGFGLILIALVNGCLLTSFFSNKFLRFIADISYSLYLTHIYAVFCQMIILGRLNTIIESTTLSWLISLPIFFAIAICLAYLLHIFVEKPFVDWSKKRYNS